jgi:sulfur carrier protein
MDVTVNGRPRSVDPAMTLGQLLQELGTTVGCAAAVDGEVVPRRRWHDHPLASGQSVEVLTAAQGG